ncbi:MAG: endonuclease/exonuclease/phosphatase family protein [Robiginitomaculum sp.]
MKKTVKSISIVKPIFIFLALCVGIMACILAYNYLNQSVSPSSKRIGGMAKAKTTFSILNWNLGYAGLGKDSDFIMDGGKNLLPPSRKIVKKNLEGIQNILENNKADFHFFQEISKPDMLTLGVDVFTGVRKHLPNYDWFYSYDFRTFFIPTKYSLKHGLALFSSIDANPVQVTRLPEEPTRLSGLIKRHYHIQSTQFMDENGKEWVIANIHMSAFDKGGETRFKQAEALLTFAEKHYAEGRHVVIGGDWNMQLVPTDFVYTTKKELLDWLAVFPHGKLKPGWQIAVDSSTPTVRSNERPYHKGKNYTTIIDGFLVSPNVEVVNIHTINTDFVYTDHQPVLAEFTSR